VIQNVVAQIGLGKSLAIGAPISRVVDVNPDLPRVVKDGGLGKALD
jgi:hypothetical protein